MTDWLAIAKAMGMRGEELERMLAPLTPLEAAFAPLVPGIPLETEPATMFRAEPEEDA
jgi:hypothetical protein